MHDSRTTYNMINLDPVYEQLRYTQEEFKLWRETKEERRWSGVVNHLEKAFTNLFELSRGTPFETELDGAMTIKKTDPLLIYIREARNTYHHSANSIVSIDKPFASLSITGLDEDGNELETITFPDELLPYLDVLPILKDRKGNLISPPETHLGISLENADDPSEVSHYMFHFLLNLLEKVKAKNV